MTLLKTTSKFDYLRFRPFLVIEMWYHPNEKVRTNRKGWWNDKANVKSEEVPSVVSHIDETILRRASIIIDVLKNVVIKNTMNVPANEFEVKEIHYKKKETDSRLKRKKNEYQPSKEHDEQVLKHFKHKYAEMIQKGLNQMVSMSI